MQVCVVIWNDYEKSIPEAENILTLIILQGTQVQGTEHGIYEIYYARKKKTVMKVPGFAFESFVNYSWQLFVMKRIKKFVSFVKLGSTRSVQNSIYSRKSLCHSLRT